MLNRSDISSLKQMRTRVQEIERRLTDKPGKSFHMGRLAEACRAVDDAIMQVLLIAMLHDLGASEEDLSQQKPAA